MGKHPMDKGSAPNEGNTNSLRAKLDRQNTIPKKDVSEAIEQPKLDKSIGNNNATKSDTIPGDTKGIREDEFRALLKPPMDKGSVPNKGNTNSSREKSDRQNTMPKKDGSQAIEQPKPDKSIGNNNATKLDALYGDTKSLRDDGFRALVKPPMDKGSVPNDGNTNSSRAKSDKPDPKHTNDASNTFISGDIHGITSGNDAKNSTHGVAERSSGSEETKGAEPSNLTNSKREINLTQDEPPPKNETENSQQGNNSTKAIESMRTLGKTDLTNSNKTERFKFRSLAGEKEIVQLNETQNKIASGHKTGKVAGEDDKAVKGDTQTDQEQEEASTSGIDTDLDKVKSN